ncbi:MAG: hypothetical protein AB8H03_05965 [Saprospiraceae bacterium]
MKNTILLFSAFIILSFTHFSCNENTVAENLIVKKGFDYYPLEIGNYITYQLDSIVYRGQSGSDCNFIQDTASHFLREEVIDIFEDNSGVVNYIMERYISQHQNGPWQVADVWNIKKTETQVERVEENLRFIKAVFPVREGTGWNGNTFFQDTTTVLGGETIDFYKHWSDQYEYESVDLPEEFNGIMFDSVMTVIQSEASENKINHRVSIEKYARGVGLIYKEMKILDTQCTMSKLACGGDSSGLAYCNDIPWEEKAEKGLILRQVVVEHN